MQTYRTDADLLADLLSGIDVHLVEVDVRELLGELLEDGADDLAWAAPLCPEVEDRVLVLSNLKVARKE